MLNSTAKRCDALIFFRFALLYDGSPLSIVTLLVLYELFLRIVYFLSTLLCQIYGDRRCIRSIAYFLSIVCPGRQVLGDDVGSIVGFPSLV